MDNEIIQLFFDPAAENIDWEKRKPRISLENTETRKQEYNLKTVTSQKKSSFISEMSEDFSNFIDDVNIRVEKYRNSGSKELLKQLDDDYRILCVNFEHFGKPQAMATCIKRVGSILHGNTKKQNEQKSIGMTDRGIQIQERLSEIKSLIKKDLSQSELREINNELIIYKNELTDNTSVFSKADNTTIKLSQIENYLCKLSQKINVNIILPEKKEVITQKTTDNTQNRQTKRGIEIQDELAYLRDEVKRKDLNPIEKENLTNALLKLQNEINSEIEKFSKFDSIPIRLNQIENYLEKLRDKKEKTAKSVIQPQKEIEEDKKEDSKKKQKKQVIWKFGL